MTPLPSFAPPPQSAAWAHIGLRTGFEVLFLRRVALGWHLRGCATGVENGAAWAVSYSIEVDQTWVTRAAEIEIENSDGRGAVALRHDGDGTWYIDDRRAVFLDGCMDVDLEASVCTNMLPVRRLGEEVHRFAAPAAFVRLPNAEVSRLEQFYVRAAAQPGGLESWGYRAPEFDFSCRLDYDNSCVVVNYPGLARRAL